MHRSKSMERLVHWCVALTAPVALTLFVRAFQAPPFALDDLTVLLVVAIALVSGLGPATCAAVLTVAADDVMPAEVQGRVRLTVLENVFDLLLLIGVALVVNLLVVRARRAQAVAERAADRERQMREDRERVVATVAHDLATPLTVVRGTVQAVKRAGLAQDSNEDRLLRRIETAATRASSLVRTLTDAGGDGAPQERKRPVDLREVLRTVAEMMQPLSDRHTIALHLPDVRIPIEADADRLDRVFENIIGNAIKYSPDGGEISVSVQQQPGQRATVVIRDHGIGIAVEARERIFDLSYRAPEALTASAGHGLGLHIAAQIVRAHGGTITAQGASGGGTAIVVILPLVDSPAPVAPMGEGPPITADQNPTSRHLA